MVNLSSVLTNSSAIAYAEPTFSTFDYFVFAGFLCISGGVGIFFSFRGQKTTDEYFFGNRQMNAIPVGISTGVSFLSASLYVGLSAEVFINGYSYMIGLLFASIGYFVGCVLICHVLHPLKVSSLNEYFAMRYNSKIVIFLANLMVLVCILEYMGLCMFGSVIAFNTITGGKVSVILALVIGGSVGIFYTAIGGLKAVVWTDVLQSAVMLSGILTVIIQSILDTPGGMVEINEISKKYQRIHSLDWSTDLTIRHSGWGMTLGMFICWGSWCVQPACVQRLCATKCIRDGYIVAGVTGLLFVIFTMLPGWAGINIFAYYISKGCDVFSAGWIEKNEVILYYVRERLNYPGFQGLFVAALYAGSLSSLSSGLNAASAILWTDIVKPLIKVEVSDFKATLISKIIVISFGIVGMIWCYTLYSFGGLILQVASSIDSSIYGAYFGLFFASIFFRYINYKGAIAGLAASFSITLWIGIGSIMYSHHNAPTLPTDISQCSIITTNKTTTVATSVDNVQQSSGLQSLYSVSYVWLATICLLIFVTVSLVVTTCTGPVNDTDPALLCAVSRPGLCRTRCDATDVDSPVDEEGENIKLSMDVALGLEENPNSCKSQPHVYSIVKMDIHHEDC